MTDSSYPVQNLLVSVIVPAYNAERFIERTLNSVLTQTYPFFEVLVIDDGSQDRTAEIVREVAQNDSRVILLQQKNAGVAAARNLGIQKSRGDLIAPVDADDLWYPQYLEKSVQVFSQSDDSVGLCYSWSIDIDEEDNLKSGFHVSDCEGEVYWRLLNRNFIGNASATVIRRQCLEKVGYYDETLRLRQAQGCEDLDLYLRIAEFYKFCVIPEFLVGYRQVASSMSKNYCIMAKSQKLVLESVQKRHPEIPQSIFQWAISNFSVYLAHQSTYQHQPTRALSWLYQALALDPTMVLMRHDLYILTVLNILQLLMTPLPMFKYQRTAIVPYQNQEITMKDINNLVTIHRWLPSRRYENFRMKKLLKLCKQYSH